MNAQAMTRHDLEAKIVQRSWEDEGFRKELLADPTGSFNRHLQVPAANLPAITVHQEEPGSWHIVLPAKTANRGTLSDQDLERIAGGTATAAVLPVAGFVVPAAIFTAIAMGTAVAAISVPVTVVEGGW
jgi:hypothetical protein